MYRNATYRRDENGVGEITLYTFDANGIPITEVHTWESHLYLEESTGKDAISMFDTKLKKYSFPSSRERYKYLEKIGDNKRIFESVAPVKEFLMQRFAGHQETIDFTKFKLRIHYMDIEIAVEHEFPEADSAKYKINVLTVYDSYIEKYMVWVMHDDPSLFVDTATEKFHVFADESDMLNSYVDWHMSNRPDVITGWNIRAFDIPYLVNRLKKVTLDRDLDLATNGKVKAIKDTFKKNQQEYNSYEIGGVSCLDYMILYRDKFARNPMSHYSLDHIASEEIGAEKLKYDGTIRDFYRNDFRRFVDYNIKDVELVVKLERKLKYIELARVVCNFGLVEYECIYKSSPYIMGALRLQSIAGGKKFISKNDEVPDDEGYEGAFVFDTIAGVYRRGLTSVDLNSLYPNVIITCNISPETKVCKVISKTANEVIVDVNGNNKILDIDTFNRLQEQCTISANNVLYKNRSKKIGILPEFSERMYNRRKECRKIADKYYDERKFIKSQLALCEDTHSAKYMELAVKYDDVDTLYQQYDNLQYTFKIFINSIYGLCGSSFSPIFDKDNAEAITLGGQLINRASAEYINRYINNVYKRNADGTPGTGNYIIAGDTDSCYINAEPITNHVIGDALISNDNIAAICAELDDLTTKLNVFVDKLSRKSFHSDYITIEYKRESYAAAGAFFARKRYALWVLDAEGKRVDKFKHTGTEMVKSEHPPYTKNYLKTIVETSIRENWTEDKYRGEIARIWEEFKNKSPDEIAIFKGYNKEKSVDSFLSASKGTGGHAKASLYYNQLISHFGITEKCPAIVAGDRVRYIPIHKYNPYKLEFLAWPSHVEFPEEFAKEFTVNYETSFEKTFLAPLNTYVDLCGWRQFNPNAQELIDIMSL